MSLTDTDSYTLISTLSIPPQMAEAAVCCLKYRIPFALYRLPGEECVFFSNPGLSSSDREPRSFRISMWNEAYTDSVIIRDELDACRTLEYIASAGCEPRDNADIFPWPISTSQLQYEGQLRQVISHLKKRGGKTVISRVVTEKSSREPSQWAEIADRIFQDNPAAMCCLYYTGETGAWICASPELLLDINRKYNTLHTVALAGTRRPLGDVQANWSEKDLQEHNIVKEYIRSRLSALGAILKISGTETCKAGSVEHLRTQFEGEIPPEITPEDILDTVSPTPALCGYPTDLALKEIENTEVHPRYCYGGYVSVESRERTQAFVNIRCVHFNDERMTLYVGSGIMPDSTPGGEWDETDAKLNTIGRCLGLIPKA